MKNIISCNLSHIKMIKKIHLKILLKIYNVWLLKRKLRQVKETDEAHDKWEFI